MNRNMRNLKLSKITLKFLNPEEDEDDLEVEFQMTA